MKAKVIALNERGGKAALTTINNQPVKMADVVTVDENTFRNLAKKGIVEAADAEAKAVNLDDPSRLSVAAAAASAEAIQAERDAQREADEQAAAKKKK